jgi:dienelactone hydrolase
VGAAGFCWGGKHVALLAAEVTKVNDKPLIDAGFTGHPSMLIMPNDVENIKLPVSFAIGDKDSHLPLEVAHKIRDIVESKPPEQRREMILYPDCNHGFCIRADISFEDVAKQPDFEVRKPKPDFGDPRFACLATTHRKVICDLRLQNQLNNGW